MYSKIKLLGHPIHPMLVAFPIAFYTATFVGYVLYAWLGDPMWFRIGFVANVAAVIGALVTAVPGFLDWLIGIPSHSRAKNTGLIHLLLNVTALVLFAVTAFMLWGQWNSATPEVGPAIVITLIGVLATVAAGYFGYTLIQNHHVGVELTPEQQRYEPADTTVTGGSAMRRA